MFTMVLLSISKWSHHVIFVADLWLWPPLAPWKHRQNCRKSPIVGSSSRAGKSPSWLSRFSDSLLRENAGLLDGLLDGLLGLSWKSWCWSFPKNSRSEAPVRQSTINHFFWGPIFSSLPRRHVDGRWSSETLSSRAGQRRQLDVGATGWLVLVGGNWLPWLVWQNPYQLPWKHIKTSTLKKKSGVLVGGNWLPWIFYRYR